jgi:hypothetical protein
MDDSSSGIFNVFILGLIGKVDNKIAFFSPFRVCGSDVVRLSTVDVDLIGDDGRMRTRIDRGFVVLVGEVDNPSLGYESGSAVARSKRGFNKF